MAGDRRAERLYQVPRGELIRHQGEAQQGDSLPRHRRLDRMAFV